MPRPLPWIKLWLDSLHNQKLIRLSLAERGAWVGLLTLAGELNAGGALIAGGQPLTLEDMAESMHVKAEDQPHLTSMVKKMVAWGSLAWNGNTLYVANWEERQQMPGWWSSTERVRRFRERQRNPLNNPPAPPRGTKEGEGEGEEEGNVPVTFQGYERVDEARGHWKKALAQLRRELNRGSFSSYLEGTETLGYDQDGFLVVQARADWQADNLNRSLNSAVRRALIKATGNDLVDIRFICPQGVKEEVR